MNGLGTRAYTTIGPLGAGGIAKIYGMPWVIAALIALGVLFILFVSAVMPQDSSDRLAWWQSLWARKDRTTSSTPQGTAPELPEEPKERQIDQPEETTTAATLSAVGAPTPRATLTATSRSGRSDTLGTQAGAQLCPVDRTVHIAEA